jgi:hypothetical protein
MNESAFALILASLMSASFTSSEAFSWIVPMRPCAMFPLMVVEKRLGSCETRPIWERNHCTLRSLAFTPSILTAPDVGS